MYLSMGISLTEQGINTLDYDIAELFKLINKEEYRKAQPQEGNIPF